MKINIANMPNLYLSYTRGMNEVSYFVNCDCYCHASIYGSFVSFFIKLVLFVKYNKVYSQLNKIISVIQIAYYS